MRLASSPAEGMILLGEALGGLADARQRYQDDAFLMDYEVRLSRGATELMSGLSNRKFTELVDPSGKDYGREEISDFLRRQSDEAGRIGQGNPRLSNAIKERVSRVTMRIDGAYTKIKDAKLTDYTRARVSEANMLDRDAYMAAGNDRERMEVSTRMASRYNNPMAFSEQEAFSFKIKDLTETHVGYVDHRLETTPQIAGGPPEVAAKMLADLTDPIKYPFLTPTAKLRIAKQFEAARRRNVMTAAYADATNTWQDPGRAAVESLNPENLNKWGLTVQEGAQMAGVFQALDTRRKQDEKDRQEANLDKIMAVAIQDPRKALSLIKDADDVDSKAALSLKNSLEHHIKTQSLMSIQEKTAVRDYEDKMKMGLKADILAGKYNNEREIAQAVVGLGVSNSSGFLDDALGSFRNYKKDAGAINFFKMAENDWKGMTTGVKSRKVQQSMRGELPRIMETLRIEMENQGLRVSDPKVFEIYKGLRKARTQTWFTSAVEKIKNIGGDTMGGTGDSFVKSPAPAAPVVAQPQGMDEKTIRAQLELKGVRGKDQDMWIERYRTAGVIR